MNTTKTWERGETVHFDGAPKRDTVMDLITNEVISMYMEDMEAMGRAVIWIHVITGRLHHNPRRFTHAMKGGRM